MAYFASRKMSTNPYAENSYAIMAGMLELRARIDAIVEIFGKEVIATKGNEEWQKLYASLEKSARDQLERTLIDVEDKSPALAAALQKILDGA